MPNLTGYFVGHDNFHESNQFLDSRDKTSKKSLNLDSREKKVKHSHNLTHVPCEATGQHARVNPTSSPGSFLSARGWCEPISFPEPALPLCERETDVSDVE